MPGSAHERLVTERLVIERLRLRERIADATRELAELHAASQDSNSDDEHDPDGATIAFERAQLEHSAQRAATQLTAVEAALARLRAGQYGLCEVCGDPIAADRLAALPSAARCVRCASR